MDYIDMDEHEPHTDEHAESNHTPIASPDLDHTPISSPDPVPSKVLRMPVKRKKTNPLPRPPSIDEVRIGSEIWDHFTKFGTPKCIHCGRDYAADSKVSGTSNLHKHIENCSVFQRLLKQQTNQKTMKDFSGKDCDGSSIMVGLKSHALDIELLRTSLSKFILMDEKPFRMVEGEGFKQFVRALEPRFILPDRTTVASDCFKLVELEKKKLRTFLKDRRLSLTTDCWTSNQNLSYMTLIAHFIDDNWDLQKRILNFCLVDDHNGDTIGKTVESCLLEWGLDKVLTITVDNASANDKAIDYLRLCNWSDVVLSNQYIHVRCSAHIVNLIVKDGLKEESDSVSKIRNVVRYIRSSPTRLKKFEQCAAYERIDCKKGVCLDIETRWNSTYLMLECAIKYRKAFERLRREDSSYDLYFSGARIGPPTSVDWAKVDALVKFLELFYEATLVFSGSKYTTSSTYFTQVVDLYMTINLYQIDSDIVLSNMANSMRAKFEKYWVDSELGNNLLFLGVIFYPRQKFNKVSFCYEQMYYEDLSSESPIISAKATYMINEIKKELESLVSFYADKHGYIDNVESSLPLLLR